MATANRHADHRHAFSQDFRILTISLADKKAIRNAYSYRLDHDPTDLDRDLYEITLSIQHDVGRFHF
jgi:hypothetical protein